MKKIILTVLLCMFASGVTTVLATTKLKNEISATGYYLNIDNVPQLAIKKFVDGKNTCYFDHVGNSIALSCVN